MKTARALVAMMLLSLALLPACHSESDLRFAHDPGAPHAECLVCKSEGDLACVDVTIEADTPRTDYNGVTYYFCSTQCRSDFEKHPAQYLHRR